MDYIIDRFEGSFAILEGKTKKKEIPVSLLPHGAKEGDCLVFDGESYVIDEKRTAEEREIARSMFDHLKKKKH